MFLDYSENGKSIRADLGKPHPIGVTVSRKQGVSSFEIESAIYKDYQSGDLIGNKLKGGPCNLETISFTPHGNSTHTECLGHIATDRPYRVNELINDTFYSAELITVDTKVTDGQNALDFESINWDSINSKCLVIRSLPNGFVKTRTDYSGQNAPAILPKDMMKIVEAGIQHILIDLPSVDPEWDGGKLSSHHIFWNYPEKPRFNCSITEFCFISDEVKDGKYILKLNIAPFESDASPSSPVLYPLV